MNSQIHKNQEAATMATKTTISQKNEVQLSSPQTRAQRMKLIIKAASQMDEAKREAFTADQAEQVFMQKRGSGKAEELKHDEAKRLADDDLKEAKLAHKEKIETAQFSVVLPDEDEGGTKRKRFRPQEIFLLFQLVPAMMMMLVTSAINVYVNVMASNPKMFLDSEWKAVLLSLAAPAGALVFKMLPMVFLRASHQEQAKRLLIALTIGVTVYWIFAFSQRFEGLGSKIDLATLLLGGGATAAKDNFVFIQIFVEMMIAACIFTWVQTILDRGIPFSTIPNPAYPLVLERCEKTEIRRQKSLALQASAEEELSTYHSDKKAFVNEQHAALTMEIAKNKALYS
jgi:hypothetical protein